MDSPVPLMRHDPDRSWITDPDLDHPKETPPKYEIIRRIRRQIFDAWKQILKHVSHLRTSYKGKNPNLPWKLKARKIY